MHSMTLEQLRTTARSGGVASVTLKGQGGGFVVEIATRSGQDAILSKARSTEPRFFGNPTWGLKSSGTKTYASVQHNYIFSKKPLRKDDNIF